MKKKYLFIGITAIAIGCIAFFILENLNKREYIAKQLEIGRKQIVSLEFEEAVATLKDILLVDPKNEEIMDAFVDAALQYANSKVGISLDNVTKTEEVDQFLLQIYQEKAIIQEAVNFIQENEDVAVNEKYQEAVEKFENKRIEIDDSEKDAETKKEELIDEEEERKKQEEAAEEERRKLEEEREREKEREQEDRDIREWMLWNKGLIKRYPAEGKYSNDHTQYVLIYGYEGDYYGVFYTFDINGDEWTLVSCEEYDSKSGTLYEPSKVDPPVGTVYNMEITPEIREEYRKYKENMEIVQNKAKELNERFIAENAQLTEHYKYTDCYFEYESDGKLYATIEYWEQDAVFSVNQIFLSIVIDTSNDSLEVVDITENGWNDILFDLEQYKGTY